MTKVELPEYIKLAFEDLHQNGYDVCVVRGLYRPGDIDEAKADMQEKGFEVCPYQSDNKEEIYFRRKKV